MPRVAGPKNAMAPIASSMAPQMNPATASTPPSASKAPVMRPAKAAANRLQEYTKPTARERMRVGKISAW